MKEDKKIKPSNSASVNTGAVSELSESTYKSQALQYKRENESLIKERNALQSQVDWLSAELAKLRTTCDNLVRNLHRR